MSLSHLCCMSMHFFLSKYTVEHLICLPSPPLLYPLSFFLPFLSYLSYAVQVYPCVYGFVCEWVVWIRWDGSLGALKAARVFAGVLVGLWFPLSRDQMSLGHLGTQPEAPDNTASPAMCEHLFSSIKTVIWIFQSLFGMHDEIEVEVNQYQWGSWYIPDMEQMITIGFKENLKCFQTG